MANEIIEESSSPEIYIEELPPSEIILESTGPPIIVYAGPSGIATGIVLSPPIPNFNAANVQEGLALLVPREFSQPTPATDWIWNHNLGYRPKPKVYNLAYQEIDAEIEQPTVNQIKVHVKPASPGYIII
jgi:hypothetical protein